MKGVPPRIGIRLVWGGLLMIAPGAVIDVFDAPSTPPLRALIRLLGVRHLLQGVSELHNGGEPSRLGSLVDALHGASAVVFGIVDARRRRLAFSDAVVAGAFAATGAPCARSRGDR